MLIGSLSQSTSRIFEIRSLDPHDARRRKLLNVLLAGVVALSIAALVVAVVMDVGGLAGEAEMRRRLPQPHGGASSCFRNRIGRTG